MRLDEAIRSGKPFKRASNETWITNHGPNLFLTLGTEYGNNVWEPLASDLLADDYELKEEPKKLRKVVLRGWYESGRLLSFKERLWDGPNQVPALDESGKQLEKIIYVEDV